MERTLPRVNVEITQELKTLLEKLESRFMVNPTVTVRLGILLAYKLLTGESPPIKPNSL